MLRIISALLLIISSLSLPAYAQQAASDKPLELNPDAPTRHVVVSGDTLWGISSTFLKDPYRWNELWRANSDNVKNPNRIYPGQVLVLDLSSGKPQLRVDVETVKLEPRIRITDTAQEIPAIPTQVIEPFLTQPLVLEEGGLDGAPRITAITENRVMAGSGDTVYTTGGKVEGKSWQIFRPGKALVDPDSGETLGYEAVMLGAATLVKPGDPSVFKIANAREEIARNDRMLPSPQPDIRIYRLQMPTKKIAARVLSTYGTGLAGTTFSIIAISKGKKDGVEVGDVLSVLTASKEVDDRYDGVKKTMVFPEETLGLVYVFRVFERVSYALVMNTSRQISVGDAVRNP